MLNRYSRLRSDSCGISAGAEFHQGQLSALAPNPAPPGREWCRAMRGNQVSSAIQFLHLHVKRIQ